MEDRSKLGDWILDQVADAVIYANHSGAIIRWNRASTALFGYSAEEALDQSIDLIIPEHLRTAHCRKLYVEMTFAIVKDAESEVLGAVAVARDVTDRVERERAASRSS